MAHYDYSPTHMNGTALAGGNLDCRFRSRNGPMQTRPMQPVEAKVPGLGDRDVRGQPRGTNWELHVILTAFDETDLDTFYETFNEEAGLVYLRADDGDGANWRVQVRVRQIRRRAENYFIVVLRVPEPVWEENAETSATKSNMSGDSDTWTMTNNGNRKARPTFTISPDSYKTDNIDDYKLSIQGFITNRAQRYWNGLPIQLFDNSGADGVLDHAALVKDTGVSNQLDGGINAIVTTIDIDTAVGGGLPTPVGMAIVDTEQIYYTGNSGAQLTGCVRGIGGTTEASHSTGAVIYESKCLVNGDDLRVWVNGVEVKRWLGGGGANSATLKCFINPHMPPRQAFTPVGTVELLDPVDGGEIAVKEDISGMPERGYLQDEDEVLGYTSLDVGARKFKGIERIMWDSTLADHDSATLYRCDIHYVIGLGKAKAGTPVTPAAERPAIDLKNSTNSKWYYGKEADDASAVFYDPATPNRPAMWLPISGVPDSDNNNAPALSVNESKTSVEWKDSDAKAGLQNIHRLQLDLPQQIPDTAAAITYDAQKRNEIRLRMLARDIYGAEVELLDLQDLAAGAVSGGQITPDNDLTALILQGVRASVAGNDTETTDIGLSTLNHGRFQRLILDHETEIESVQLRLKKTGGGESFTYVVYIYDDSGTKPEDGAIVAWLDTSSAGNFTQAGLTSGYLTYEYTASTGNINLQAGTYWIAIALSVYSAGTLNISAGLSSTKHNAIWDAVAQTYGAGNFLWFRVIHPHGGPVQPETVTLHKNTAADFDLFELVVGATDVDGHVLKPYVEREASFAANLYHCVGVITNITTGDVVTIDQWMKVGAPVQALTINCETRTVTYTEAGFSIYVPRAITPSNVQDWMPLDPGANSMSYAEDNMVSTDLTHAFRGKKV